jgi:hypothetical protein
MYQVKILRCSSRGGSKRKADMAPKLASMAERGVISLAVADDGGVLREVMEDGPAGMAQTPVPGGWGGSCHKCAGTGRTLRELQGVEGPKTLTSQQRGLGAEILYRNTKRVKFNRNTIVSGKFANREKVLEDVGSNENITKMEWSWDCGVSSANNRESGTITHNDGGRENRGAGGSDHTSMRGDMRGGAGVDHPIRGGWWRVERDSA